MDKVVPVELTKSGLQGWKSGERKTSLQNGSQTPSRNDEDKSKSASISMPTSQTDATADADSICSSTMGPEGAEFCETYDVEMEEPGPAHDKTGHRIPEKSSASNGTATPTANKAETEKKKAPFQWPPANYFDKILRHPTWFPKPKRISFKRNIIPSLWSFLGAFVGMFVLAVLNYLVLVPLQEKSDLYLSLLAYSFGATAVLVYDVPDSPLAQPRNVVGGHVISAVVGITLRQFLLDLPWVGGPLAVALSISLMRLSHTTHPPGGATALLAAVAPNIGQGPAAYIFVVMPILSGALFLLVVAIVINNLSGARSYPKYWL